MFLIIKIRTGFWQFTIMTSKKITHDYKKGLNNLSQNIEPSMICFTLFSINSKIKYFKYLKYVILFSIMIIISFPAFKTAQNMLNLIILPPHFYFSLVIKKGIWAFIC